MNVIIAYANDQRVLFLGHSEQVVGDCVAAADVHLRTVEQGVHLLRHALLVFARFMLLTLLLDSVQVALQLLLLGLRQLLWRLSHVHYLRFLLRLSEDQRYLLVSR